MKFHFVLIVVFALSAEAIAYEPERAKTNQAHELAVCVEFYSIGSDCAKKTNSHDQLAVSLLESAEAAYKLSVGLSNYKVTNARVLMANEELMSEIDGDCSNVSILLYEYADLCKHAVEDPESRFQYWLDKQD